MWLALILLSLALRSVASDHSERSLQSPGSGGDSLPTQASTVRGQRGPFRLKFLNEPGDSFQTVSGAFSVYPDPIIDTLLEGIKIYFSKALEVDQLTSGITVANCNGVAIPLTYDTDFIILIKNVLQSEYLAGSTCYNQHDGNRNAVAGMIQIFPGFNSIPSDIQIILFFKRTLKILGFSESQLPLWRNPSGNAYSQVTTTKFLRGATRRLISTPKVVEKTLEAFGYNAGGMELEDNIPYDGEDLDTLSWEGRILPYEILAVPFKFDVSITFENNYISTITLAMLEDSGWYYPNYNMAQLPLIRRNGGQQWFEEACPEGGTPYYPNPFGIGTESLICSPLGNSKSFVLTEALQYKYADSCSIPIDIASCYPSSQSIFGYFFKYPFEAYNENSRCFYNQEVAFCFEVTSCADNSITFKAGTDTYVCQNEGDQIIISALLGLSAYPIICPKYEYICRETSCYNLCTGRGYCQNSKCICFQGFTGSDCSQPCDISCKECSSSSAACTSCNTGFYININICVPCDSNCKTCSDSAVHCTSCNNGLFLDGNQCLSCDSKCSVCNSLTECTGCVSSYHLHNGACCPLGCNTCSSNECLTCDIHYFLMFGICTSCPIGCHLCENGECSSCDERYFKDGRTCSQCDISCLSCLTATNCITCNIGYLSVGNGLCINCPAACTGCSNGVCEGCVDNFHLVGNICCPVGCSTCDLERCLTCSDGYLYVDGDCVVCPGNCVSCASGLCIGCQEGYYARNHVCEPCINGCAQCSNELTCSVCLPAYSLNSADTCDKRTSCSFTGCSWCTQSVCYECNAGFYLSSGSCYPCANGCLFCTGYWECVACSIEYTKVGGSCCDKKKCKNCTPFGCTECKPQYLLSSGVCENCPDNYENRGNSICERCKKGFYFNGTSCVTCPTNCLDCKLEGLNVACYSCKGKSRLTNGKNCEPI